MGKWKTCTIGDLGTIVGGATPSTKNPDNYDGGSIAWITPKDLAGFSGRFISHGERNITELGLNSCSAQIMPAHTVLFSSRAPIGYIAIAEQEVCTNQGFKSVVPNDSVDYMFLYYLLKYYKDRIENLGSGTTFKEVSGSTMRSIEVSVPVDLKEQIRIASILSSLDTRIENNNKINQNLYEQFQTIYCKDFDPVSHEVTGVLSDICKLSTDKVQISLPNSQQLIDFNAVVKPIIEQIIILTRENKQLTVLRDSLLPKLMSGEIDVSEIEI